MSHVQVDVWYIPIKRDMNEQMARQLLSPEELQRCERLQTPELQRDFLAVHSAKRQILSRYLSVVPQDIQFEEGPHGKPAISGASVEFNLSHSGGQCLLAVADGVALGVDVEQVSRQIEVEQISERFFCADECRFILQDSEQQRERFFKIWVRKEAVVKLLGEGLMRSLQSFSVVKEFGDNRFAVDWFDDTPTIESYYGCHLPVLDEYQAALMVAASEIKIKCHEYDISG